MKPRYEELIELLHKEFKPALGCTEPIAVALAVAKAVEILIENCTLCKGKDCTIWRQTTEFDIHIEVSSNILKNGMGVGIPGTGMIGLPIAAALGAVCGNSSLGLEVLNGVSDAAISRAKYLVKNKKIRISVAKNSHLLYVKANVSIGDKSQSYVIIQDDHDKIVETCFANKILSHSEAASAGKDRCTLDYNLSVEEIFNFALDADYEDIKFILDDKKYNLALAFEGLKGDYGLRVGKTIAENNSDLFGNDFMSYAMSLTAAASDARMAGCTLPAMSNSGSGNQGITVSLPVIAYALKYNISDEKLARALIISNLIAIHIKGYLGKLSALCGCVIASTGASCGLVYLRGGDYEQICSAIKNMVGNITGMVCDGAKVGCAMKVASGVSSAIQSAILAGHGRCVKCTDGIIDKDVEQTIKNLGKIGAQGMRETDNMILDIMVCK